MHTTADHDHFLPGMGRHLLTPLYDPLTRLLGVRAFHRELLAQADVPADGRVLEIGCGTGNLALLVGDRHPTAEVVGIDPDEAALARARRKAGRRGLDVRWDTGLAQQLPYPDGAFDRVLSALMLHHLDDEDRVAALREAERVLAPGGALHLVDFGGRTDAGDGFMARRMVDNPRLRASYGDGLRRMLGEAGFTEVTEEAHRVRALMGRVTFHRAATSAS